MKRILSALLSLLSFSGLALPQDSPNLRKQLTSGATFGTVRRIFSNQKVVIRGRVVNLSGSVLIDWHIVRKNDDGRYEGSVLDNLPSTYQGKTATVLALQIKETKQRELRPNALGEIVSSDDTVDPYFDLVVGFDDGAVAMCSAYPITISDNVALASDAAALTQQMSQQLPLIVGKSIYAVGYSKLYKPDTTLDEMTGTGSPQQRLSAVDVPLLVPLTISAARYFDSTGVILKVKLPNGSQALSFVDRSLIEQLRGIDGSTFIQSVTGGFLSEIPKKMTQKEIDAIRHGTIFKGMSKDAVEYLLGFPEKANDWGRGGKQLLYYDGSLLVYLGHDGKVDDWQSLSKK